MKRTLCRAKRQEDKCWVFGSLVYDNEGNAYIIPCEFAKEKLPILGIPAPVIPETIGHYTGKTVKNIRLFSGDILFARHSRLLVDWDEEFYAFWVYYFGNGEKVRLCPLCEIAPWEMGSIIGNIYDNPEKVDKF